ncbi:MAG TPA: peptidase [Chromatiales bacterium]|nr:peptidase [Chromatiales bacterium]
MPRVIPSALATCATLAMSVPAFSADVSFSGVLPMGQLYTAPVESMLEARYRNIVRQKTDFSCGAAAMATLLRYAYDLDVDEEMVMQGMMQAADPELVKTKGFSLLDIKRYAESLGFRGRGYRLTLDRLRTLRVPTIVLLDIRGYKHFVVLKQVRGDQVDIADPALGNKSMPLEEFIQSWPSQAVFAVIGNGFNRNTALLEPHRTLSAKTLFAAQGPITEAELLDFGFTHADLF